MLQGRRSFRFSHEVNIQHVAVEGGKSETSELNLGHPEISGPEWKEATERKDHLKTYKTEERQNIVS